MKLYEQSISINVPKEKVWEFIADLNNFGRFSPYHHGPIRFHTSQRQGVHTEFSLRHSYSPIFPIPNTDVLCRVTDEVDEEDLSYLKIDEKPLSPLFPLLGQIPIPLMGHSQAFKVTRKDANQTELGYSVAYLGLPRIAPRSSHQHVNDGVNQTMRAELQDIKDFLEAHYTNDCQ